jgi:hypothetical protein
MPPDGYIADAKAARGFGVATGTWRLSGRAGVAVVNPWAAQT